MGKTIEQFDFSLVKMGKHGDLPIDPWVRIQLKHWGTVDGSPVVSAQLASEAEIDEQVRALKADLDVVAGKARAALRKAREQTHSLVSARVARRNSLETPPIESLDE